MAEIDKILEAEKTITTISKELSKMKSAVELMDSTKTKADAVIQTGETVVENINSFVEQGSALVEKIGDFDIQSELEKIKNQLTSLKKDLSDKTKTMGKNIDGLNNGMKKLEENITVLFKQNEETAQQNQLYLYFAIGANILIAGAVALKIFGFIN
jgi:chaperonin cofactor prefoldin